MRLSASPFPKLQSLLQVDYVALFLYDHDNHILIFKQHNRQTLLGQKIPLQDSDNLIAYVVEQNHPLFFSTIDEYQKQVNKNFSCLQLYEYLENHCALLPMALGYLQHRELVGVLVLADRLNGEEFNEVEQQIAILLAEVMAHSISRCKLIEPSRSSSIADSITSTFRWHPFYENLAREVYRAGRYDLALSLIMIDLDNFDNINNRFGTPIGDQILQESATLIHQSLRNIDIVSRKDDSFLIVLPETPVNGAMIVAERLRKSFAQHVFQSEERKISATVSLGVVGYQPGDNPVSFLKNAELALARAFEKGGNQIIVYNIMAEG